MSQVPSGLSAWRTCLAAASGSPMSCRQSKEAARSYPVPEKVAAAETSKFLTAPPLPARVAYDFDQVLDTTEGWAKQNRHYWLRDWRGYAEFFFGELLSEPHSTERHRGLRFGWAMEIGPETTVLVHDDETVFVISSRVPRGAPASGEQPGAGHPRTGMTAASPGTRGERVAALTGGELLLLEGAGHLPNAREPVVVDPCDPRIKRPLPLGPLPQETRRTWTRPPNRPRPGALRLLANRPRSRPPRPGHRRRAPHAQARPRGALAGPAPGDGAARGGALS